MSGNAPMRINRPAFLYLIVAFYTLAPVANIILFRTFTGLPFATILHFLGQAVGPLATAWLLTAPVVGVAFFFATKLTWYAFLGHSSLIFIDYIMKWATRPGYFWSTVGSTYQVLMLAGNLALASAIVLVCSRNFRTPYLQGVRRGWRVGRRIPVRHWIAVNGRPSRATSISSDGCYVAEPEADLVLGQIVSLNFQSRKLKFECTGIVVRQDRQGFGLQYLFLPASIREDIRRTIQPRVAIRHDCRIPCTLRFDGEQCSGVLRNLSTGGCFIETRAGEMPRGTATAVFVAGLRRALDLRVAWSSAIETAEMPAGLGARFAYPEARAVRRLEQLYTVA